MGIPSPEHQPLLQKLDAPISYGGGGSLALASLMADLATAAQQIGLILGCAVMAFKLFRDIEEYIAKKKKKKDQDG